VKTLWRWPIVGLAAGWAGLAVSWFAAEGLGVRSNPVVAVAEQLVAHLPGGWIESGIQTFGHHDKTTMIVIILAVMTVLFAVAGWFSRRTEAALWALWVVLGLVGGLAVAAQADGGTRAELPVLAGFVTWLWLGTVLTTPLRPPQEPDDGRRFVLRTGVVVTGSAVAGLLAPHLGTNRRAVEQARATLVLPGVTKPVVPAGADLGLAQPWETPSAGFYRIDTAFLPPEVAPGDWSLRIHGMVDHEITLSFDDLLARRRTQAWITLNCVSNEVGGDLISNAWWSGVLLRDLLQEAGVQAGADAVLQTSHDGWTCGTPLEAMTDARGAMLAVAMNGEPLPVDHGFPVRTVVPGLFGYVSACKWVVDLEVTTMQDAIGYWVDLGWAQQGPVKLASRIDRPEQGKHVPSGSYTLAGVAWEQLVGIKAVDISIDGGPWLPCTLGRVPNVDTWVQWSCTTQVGAGSHSVQVRATDRQGVVQTAVKRDVVPDGATGWHTVHFEAS
jgi:DMSO/TMAO reductase YedYZ molybdopterin-dependent catalytic subunit